MTFAPGDRVHLAGVGTGVVREARGSERYALEIKGRLVVAPASELEPAQAERKTRKRKAAVAGTGAVETSGVPTAVPSLDLHGNTVEEALAALEAFLNDTLLAGCEEARVIHGRSGGRVKTAAHTYLRQLAAVKSFRVDPRNAGVTIVTFA